MIAIVDDEASMLVGLQRLLDASGFATGMFDSAEEFLNRKDDIEVNCFVLDINLGGMSGIELRRRLAASGSKAPVIFISADDDDAIRQEAMEAGCAAFLDKPFTGRLLIDAIKKAAA